MIPVSSEASPTDIAGSIATTMRRIGGRSAFCAGPPRSGRASKARRHVLEDLGVEFLPA